MDTRNWILSIIYIKKQHKNDWTHEFRSHQIACCKYTKCICIWPDFNAQKQLNDELFTINSALPQKKNVITNSKKKKFYFHFHKLF